MLNPIGPPGLPRISPGHLISPAHLRSPGSRRAFLAAGLTLPFAARFSQGAESGFAFNFILGSCLYGTQKLSEILPEVRKTGAAAIDIWPRVHGNQREQIDALGEDRFAEMLDEHGVRLGCITQYKLGPFALQDEMRFAARLGCSTIVTGAEGPRNLKGPELKTAVSSFVEKMKPHLAVAEETGVTIAIENHGNNLIESPDSIRWLAEFSDQRNLAIALAPYHLPQDARNIARLIQELGSKLVVFYAWQHGQGCMQEQPKELELLQMPGRGDLDFDPIVEALKAIRYAGWTEIFMHPFPRGIPILPETSAVTEEINRARRYLEGLV